MHSEVNQLLQHFIVQDQDGQNNNKIEQFNKYNRNGVYKLTCTNCNKFYIGRTNSNFNTIFEEHGKDVR